MHFSPGDPTFIGWAVCLLYLVVSLLCLHRTKRAPRISPKECIFWRLICGICLVLGLNKQLDLQTSLLSLARSWGHSVRLYQYKYYLKVGFMTLLTGSALAVSLVVWRALHPAREETQKAAFGMSLIAAFVLLRAGRFQGLPFFLQIGNFGEAIIEVLGLMIVLNASLSSHSFFRTSN